MAKGKNKYKYITVCYALTSPIKKQTLILSISFLEIHLYAVYINFT